MMRDIIPHGMSIDPAVPEPAGAPEVMASIDGAASSRRLIIADVSADESWVSIPAANAIELPDWR